MDKRVSIIGAGLSGCEAALVLARNGFQVTLYDQKPSILSSAYVLPSFAELVCNNVFAPWNHNKPLGLLLSELSILKSPLIELAGSSRIQDNAFLCVDKKDFSHKVTSALSTDNVKIISRQLETLPEEHTVILATGPLTCDSLVSDVAKKAKAQGFHFADASSIVVDIQSVDTNNLHISKLTDDLFIVKLEPSEFQHFYEQLLCSAPPKAHIEEDYVVFEECQSIENIAKIGKERLLSRKFRTPIMPGICFLLRRENGLENGFILSGFMTTLCHEDQRRVIRTLPGFENVQIIKYGRAHRNTFFDAPCILDEFYKVDNKELYIIGQLSGVDGYVPCISSGFVAAHRIIHGEHVLPFPRKTMIGALAHYVSNKSVTEYTPMGPSFSLISPSASKENEYYPQSLIALNKYLSEF